MLQSIAEALFFLASVLGVFVLSCLTLVFMLFFIGFLYVTFIEEPRVKKRKAYLAKFDKPFDIDEALQRLKNNLDKIDRE